MDVQCLWNQTIPQRVRGLLFLNNYFGSIGMCLIFVDKSLGFKGKIHL